MQQQLQISSCLPQDAERATLVGRVWVEGSGPVLVNVRPDGVYDLGAVAHTMSDLLELADPVAAVRQPLGKRLGDVAAILSNSEHTERRPELPWFLAPCDLQCLKATGVTFVNSVLERVIEEQARGDAAKAESVRRAVVAVMGDNLSHIKPGSPEAAKLKDVLLAQGAWSQYLEVGIGPDAEIFTKAQVMSAVGIGAEIGIHPGSVWNNPEPEIVLVVASTGKIIGATLGNDVNLRDVEGRSALLLGKAKDNNASTSLGPFIRFFDDEFSYADICQAELSMKVTGLDGFVMSGHSNMNEISRPPADIVGQAINEHHQYPDGLVVFCGTMFAPIDDRGAKGKGFTHHTGDIVEISTPLLGTLSNRKVGDTASIVSADGKTVKILCVGKKGRDQLRRQYASLIVGYVDLSVYRNIGAEAAQIVLVALRARAEALGGRHPRDLLAAIDARGLPPSTKEASLQIAPMSPRWLASRSSSASSAHSQTARSGTTSPSAASAARENA